MPCPQGRGTSLLLLLVLVLSLLSPVWAGTTQDGGGQPPLPVPKRGEYGGDHPSLGLDDLESRPLPLGLVSQDISGINAVAVGDADDDGEAELLTTRGWDVLLWTWDGDDFVQEGCFTVPFSVEAHNRGLFTARIADADGSPGNEVLVVAAASDVGDDPWVTDGRFFIYRHDGGGGYDLVVEESTGTFDPMLLRTPADGAYVVENCLAVSDLTGDGEPEIVLGLAFYTRTTRVYRLRGDGLEMMWEDEEDTADSNAVLPYRLGDESVLLVGMGYGSPARTGFQVRTFRWSERLRTFARGPVTDVDGAVRSLQAGDLDGDGRREVVLCANKDPADEGLRDHIMVLRPNADLTMRTLLDMDMDYVPTDVRVRDMLPMLGSEVVVGANGGSPVVLSFARGLGSPEVYIPDAYGPSGKEDGNVTILCEGGLARADLMGNEEGRLVVLRCGPDLALGGLGGGNDTTLRVEEGARNVSVRLENVGAVTSGTGRLRLALEDGWTGVVEVPPVPPGGAVETDVPLPEGPYDGNATVVIEHSRPEEEVFYHNDGWEGRLLIPPVAARTTGDGPPGGTPPLFLVLIIVVLVSGAAVARRTVRARSGRERPPGAPPVLIWKRNSLRRKERVLRFVNSRGSRGAGVRDVARGLDIASNTARRHLSWLHEEGRLNRYMTSSGWLFVRTGVDPPPGALHGLGRTASAMYGLVLTNPGLTAGELVDLASGAGEGARLMSQRMAEYNLGTLTEEALVVRLRRPDGRGGVWPRALLLLEDLLTEQGAQTPWKVVRDHLAARDVEMTVLEARLLGPHLGVRVVKRDGELTILVDGA